MTNIWLLQAGHRTVPGTVTRAFTTQVGADRAAAMLLAEFGEDLEFADVNEIELENLEA